MKTYKNSSKFRNYISKKQKLLLIPVAFLVISLVFIGGNLMIGFSQTQDKEEKEIKKSSFKNEPIEILELESGGAIRKFSEKYKKKGDWLKDLKIKFKNTSGKTITFVEFGMLFHETGKTGRVMYYLLRFGVNPRTKKPADESKFLKPNSVSSVSLSEEQYERLKKFLAARQSLDSLTNVNIQISSVYFSDKTMWYAGNMFRPDPDRPGRFLRIDDEKNKKKGGKQK